jgi:NitT/TauT family transport system permease protein
MQAGVIVLLIIVWQSVYKLGIGSKALNRGPLEVWQAFVRLNADYVLLANLWATMQAVVIALGLAIVVGVTIGLVLALMPRLEEAVQPVLSGLNSMPRVALAPLFIIAFGFGVEAKVALAFSVVVFILILNARAGVRSADPDVMRMAEVMNISRTQKFFKLFLPVAVPSIFAGIRLGLVYSLLGVVTSELISANDGLGQLIAARSAQFQMADVYAILIVLAIVAAILNTAAGWAERRLLYWQPNP